MSKQFVLTLTGTDRIGLVEHVTELILECDGDVQASRMARLGGEFAMLMLVSIPDEKREQLSDNVKTLVDEGFQVLVTETEPEVALERKDWLPYQIQVRGANQEGIIHEIAEHLSAQGVTIESIDSDTVPAPMSGTPIFTMDATVLLPPGMSGETLRDELDEIANGLNVDLEMFASKENREK